ncbi:MAG: hypothetical protein COV66_08040 [Nitrospinae bacterium CG11_big_fil_rev_8_21_14_0_20_45_15]|nr:MAG: hypothetical protein COV66_08040 [Nitrospinae bacterium CG11_big_fil_rev_8_21_14_0_20_45_15]
MASAKIRIEFDDRFTRESQKALENFRKNYQQMFKEFQANASKESGFNSFSQGLGVVSAGLAAGAANVVTKLTDKGIGQLLKEAFTSNAEKIKEIDRLNLEIYEREQGITAQRIADIEKITNKKNEELRVQSEITTAMDRVVTKTKEISDIQSTIQAIEISVFLKNSERVVAEALQLYSGLRSIFSTPLYQEVRIRPVLDGSGGSSSGDIGQNPGGFYTSVSSRIGATRLAKGADFIPYDDFPASLHRGEAVLPADVADRYRKGAVAGNITIDKFNVVISGDNKRPEDLARDLYFHLKRIGQHIEASVF